MKHAYCSSVYLIFTLLIIAMARSHVEKRVFIVLERKEITEYAEARGTLTVTSLLETRA